MRFSALKYIAGLFRGIKGYSLIETAVVISVGGLLVLAVAEAGRVYILNKQVTDTTSNASQVVSSLSTYLVQVGAYPCPASMSAVRGSPLYGFPSQCDPTQTLGVNPTNPYPYFGGPPTHTNIPLGSTLGGLTEFTSDRVPALTNPLIRRGAVPFRVLGIPESASVDGYGNRFQYWVTEALAVPTTYNRANGGIDVVDDNLVPPPANPNCTTGVGCSIVAPPSGATGGAAQYVLVSSGPDGAGSTSLFGGSRDPCPATFTLDKINCQVAVGPSYYARVRQSHFSPQAGNGHFDDFVLFYSSTETPMWKVSDTAGFNVADLVSAGDAPTAGKVGIKTPSPDKTGANSSALQVGGQIHANGNLMALELCDSGDTKCLTLNNFSLPCPAGQYMTGVANGAPSCAPSQSVTCGSGQVLTGIDASGNLVCTTVIGCPATPKTLCSPDPTPPYGSQTIPAGVQGQTWTSVVDGISYQKSYVCGSNGQWQHTSTVGTCSCTPQNATNSETCNAYYGYGNWTGNVSVNTVTVCPANTTTTTVTGVNNCICSPTSQTTSGSCPYGFTGSTTLTNNWICSSSTSGYYSGWNQTASSCTCQAGLTQNSTQSCPSGYSGQITMTSTIQCPSGTWSTPVQTGSTCTCTGGQNYQTIGCPSPQIGNQFQSQTFDCGTNTWGPWTTYQNNCGTATHTWMSVSTQTGPNGASLPVSMNSTCTTAQVGTQTQCSSPDGSSYWYQTCQCY